MARVFISFAREDLARAQRLHRDFADRGHRPFLDKIDLQAGANWRIAISNEIRQCDFFLALLSNHSLNKRGFVQSELKQALDVLQELPGQERFLIPVRLEECQFRDQRLADLHWVDLFPSYPAGLVLLLAAVDTTREAAYRSYANTGVEIPKDIANWEESRLFRYIEEVLWPEAINRALADFRRVEIRDLPRALNGRAREKMEEVALRYSFVDTWRRYENPQFRPPRH
ncbi:MAG: toll/interleukin-1 receptor domain-containing protein [Gammaproteobacteria bacterium]